MKTIYTLCSILICSLVLACQPSDDLRTEHLGARVALAASGDSLQINIYYNLRSADSAKFTVSSTNGQPAISRTATTVAGTLVFKLLGPPEGQSDTVTIQPIAYKSGQTFVQATITKVSAVRGITPPGTVTDSVLVKDALLNSKLVDTALMAITTGETCAIELRDFHRVMLIAPRGPQTQTCMEVFNGDVERDNARSLVALAAGYPWTLKQDSIWQADSVWRPQLPKTFMNTAYHPNPMSDDTLVFGGGADNNISIVVYRQRHPDFQWGS